MDSRSSVSAEGSVVASVDEEAGAASAGMGARGVASTA